MALVLATNTSAAAWSPTVSAEAKAHLAINATLRKLRWEADKIYTDMLYTSIERGLKFFRRQKFIVNW